MTHHSKAYSSIWAVTELDQCSRGSIIVMELMESLAKFIKLDALYWCSDGSEWQDSSHYERENAQIVIRSNQLRCHLGYDDPHDGALSAVMTGRIELSSAAPAERKKQVRFAVEAPVSPGVDERLLEELHKLCEARESITAFILRHSHMKAKPGRC
jgi:KUP system potassium uptake protein